MTGSVLRLAVFAVLLNGLTLITALTMGHSAQAKIVMEYLRLEYYVYPVRIRDPIHKIDLHVAGRGCFEALPLAPEWIAVSQQSQIIHMEQFQISSDLSPEMIERIKCRVQTTPDINLQGLENSR